MADIKLYLDEDISPVIGVVLRSRGYDVVSTHEVDMNSREDKEQLDYAIKNKRALLTFNARHFAPYGGYYDSTSVNLFDMFRESSHNSIEKEGGENEYNVSTNRGVFD